MLKSGQSLYPGGRCSFLNDDGPRSLDTRHYGGVICTRYGKRAEGHRSQFVHLCRMIQLSHLALVYRTGGSSLQRGGATVIAIILFILLVGSVFAVMDKRVSTSQS